MAAPALDTDLLARIDRIESHLAIQQLPMRYAVAIDARDIDTWLNLFVPDIDCGRHGRGREALRKWIDPAVRTFYRSHHQICGHAIDFIDADHATGKVYCRAEHEDHGKWIVMAICYFDTYERREGHWYFARRQEEHWYSTDVLERPEGPDFQRWAAWAQRKPKLPHLFPTWNAFWAQSSREHVETLSKAP
jgi:hypothetical protein